MVVAAVLGALTVLVATRRDPVLSPDSITYLSAAERLRNLEGYADFTGEPLAHFPPVFPALLALGGRSLLWASIVGAAGAAAAAALFAQILSSRVRWSMAVAGTLIFVLSQATIRTASTVWSETPYVVAALATLAVLARRPLTAERAAIAGLVAGLGFLTRYAGAGLVLTGLVMLLAATVSAGRRETIRCAAAYTTAASAVAVAWTARNLVATGQPFGPHFEGGADESLDVLVRRLATALGRLVIDIDVVGDLTDPIGYAVLAGLVGVSIIALVRRPVDVLDIGMAAFALTSILVPFVSRILTGTHIEARIMFPALVPIVYFAIVMADRVAGNRALLIAGLVVAVVWCAKGAIAVRDFPDRIDFSAGNPAQFSPELYDLVAALPDEVDVLTNNPQRVWWHTGHDPTLFAFTRPTPGNSHFPLSPAETVDRACAGAAYLAWFPGLGNALGRQPAEIRPDVAELVDLVPVERVPGGELFRLTVRDQGDCG